MTVKVSLREAYGKALSALSDKYDFWVLDADLSKATKTQIFADKCPQRFFNMGISEGDLMSTAAGIATCGKTVFASTFAMFAAGRAYDQVRNSIAYPNLNVKVAATHGGILIGEDGGSHQCVEDIALMRAIPGMTVIVPSDAVETQALVEQAILYKGPVYLRLGTRYDVPVIYNENEYTFEIGKSIQVKAGNDVTIIATGEMVCEAIVASEELKNVHGISARVIDMHTIKPIDKDMVIKCAKETGAVVTVEDHNVLGGLGGAVAEVLIEEYPVPMKRIGVMDKFGRSGTREALAEMYGLNSKAIIQGVKALLKRG
ncbi:transketolase family protein [Petroclostridium sp. X23]|uniref:transketolase family protein n=1 Tax=Petroclostridium sp. X23 TaxID=3045146 RepID=UPI0024AD2851|nr:transketolase family protein [Petroclostridium sp. X23]WHH56839.1 transketolase family protein [Petroclostridium sp. X23]